MPPFQPSHFILESMVLFGLARGSLRRRTPQKGGEVRWDFSSFQWGEMPSLSHLLPVGCKNLLGEWLNPKRNVVHGFIFWYKKLVKAGLGFVRNEHVYSVESSLQRILSNLLLRKRNKLLVVIQTWSWRGKPAASAWAWLCEANAER